jgi:hypothetical protein
MAFKIGNINNPPLNNINGSLVNIDSSSVAGIPFSNTIIPTGPHTLAPAGGRVDGAAGIYPCAQKGGLKKKINRNKINKISNKYKMKGSKKTIKRHIKRIKSRVRSKYLSRHTANKRRSIRRRSTFRRRPKSKHSMIGGSFQPPMVTPNYPAGHNQYLNNNGSLSNTYSLGGNLAPANSALANPPIQHLVKNASVPDNLNHNTLNANGNIGSGSGFPSRGWF